MINNKIPQNFRKIAELYRIAYHNFIMRTNLLHNILFFDRKCLPSWLRFSYKGFNSILGIAGSAEIDTYHIDHLTI